MISINGYTEIYLAFSLFLALIPFGLSYILYVYEIRSKWISYPLFMLWVLMFPNIPYLFTKGRYLMGYCGSTSPWELCGNSWQIGFFFLHGLVGVPLMYLSIQYIAKWLKRFTTKINHGTVALAICSLSAFAIPIGLYGRFNSWNIGNTPNQIITFYNNYLIEFGLTEIVFWVIIYMLIYFVIHWFSLYVSKSDIKLS